MKKISKSMCSKIILFCKNFWTIFEEYDELKILVRNADLNFWQEIISPIKKSTGVLAFFPYKENIVKKAILMVKEGGEKEIIKIFTEAIHDHLLEEIAEENEIFNFENVLVLSIPLFKEKFEEKGFNHSAIFAKEIAKILNFTYEDKALIKKRKTKDQHGLSKEEREKNLKNSFEADESKISGKNILLIDDVTTTGVTLLEAEKELFTKKARRVLKIAIAY